MKFNIKEIPIKKAYRLINHGPTVVITTYDGNYHNGATIAWITPIEMDPPLFLTSISNTHKTYKNIEATKEAVVNIPVLGQEKLLIYLGTVSGNEVKDKLKEVETFPSKYVKPLRIAGCAAWIETKLEDKIYIKEIEHNLLILRGCGAFVRDDLISRGYILNIEQVQTLHHLGGKYFGVVTKKLKVD